MNRTTVICDQVTKFFGEGPGRVDILKGINFTAFEHEMIMLMGPSGSGKTTLLSIVGGILTQTSGTCLVLDTPINQLPEAQRTLFRGENIGFLFQHFALVPTLTALENVAIPLLLNDVPRPSAFEQASEFLDKLGLAGQKQRTPNNLSGGEQQRVALARACINKPKILLCDEPTSFLDKTRGTQIMELLRAIKEETSCTILVVTHDPRIVPYADRIFELDDGLLFSRQSHEVVSRPEQQLT